MLKIVIIHYSTHQYFGGESSEIYCYPFEEAIQAKKKYSEIRLEVSKSNGHEYVEIFVSTEGKNG